MSPTPSPGPATYTLKKLVGFENHENNSLKPRLPQWSLGLRVKNNPEYTSPGPASYNIREFTQYGKAFEPSPSMRARIKSIKLDPNPGPVYNAIDTTLYRWKSSPKYTLGVKLKPLTMDIVPSPNSAAPTPIDTYKTRAPKYPLFGRRRDNMKKDSPGPNIYSKAGEDKLKVLMQYPAYSLRAKTSDPLMEKDKKPGPSSYNLIDYHPFRKSPAYTMRCKHSEYAHVPIVKRDNC